MIDEFSGDSSKEDVLSEDTPTEEPTVEEIEVEAESDADIEPEVDPEPFVPASLEDETETVNIEIPDGFDVAAVNVTHNADPDNGYYVDRTYYVLIDEGSTLDAGDIEIFDFIENSRNGDVGADQISIDGDYGFILGMTTGTTSLD